MDKSFKYRTGIYMLVSLVVLTVLTTVCYLMNIDENFEGFVEISYFDLLMEQIANTLIVLSLTSVLSTNFGQAYWIDIKDTKLVTPFWGCFIGITVYLLTALVFSLIAFATGFNTGVVVSAVLATVLLIILTFKMISIYFGKDELKKQLSVEYKHKILLKNNSYVEDYFRRLQKYLEEVEGREFTGKSKYIGRLKEEIQVLESGLRSKDEHVVDAVHKEHIDKYIKGLKELDDINLKIEEYTKNAINNNEIEVVRENIELLVECENYDTFFNLIEALFNWDEVYACRVLKDLSEKNMAWLEKDRVFFFKQYALQKLMEQSGKLDAIQNLLSIYDMSNLGMSKLEPRIALVSEKSLRLQKREVEVLKEVNNIEDIKEGIRREREVMKQIKQEDEQLRDELISILESGTTKDFRSFYIPIKEACIAYDEGKYETVNKYVMVILTNYKKDMQCIWGFSGLSDIQAEAKFTFSYVTEEEFLMIYKLIEKDKKNHIISESDKDDLLKMAKVTIDNNPWSHINAETLEIFNATLDISKESITKKND